MNGIRSGLLAILSGIAVLAWAQDAPMPSGPSAATPAKAHKTESSPAWASLSVAQQKALAPLRKLWPEINEAQKRKWLALAVNFRLA
jgi:hypothetical protein